MEQSPSYVSNEGLLAPYRALDLTDEKGLLCGKILADMGMDVIKIERPGGDPARQTGPFYHDIPDPEKSLYWWAFNTNKRGITLNLETARGRDLFKKLVKTADFVIESYDPGYMDGAGLGYGELKQANPGIILVSITHFGQKGPYAGLKGSDMVDFAMGAMMVQCGDPDRPPVQVSFPQSYAVAGSDAAEGAMVAFHHRQLTGEGQQVDVSAQEGLVWQAGESVLEWDAVNIIARRPGGMFLRPSGLRIPVIWECKDGYVDMFMTGGHVGARTNRRLVEWMSSEGMAPDFLKEFDWDNWDWGTTTQAQMDRIVEPIARFFKTHTKAEVHTEAVKRVIQLYPVYNARETVENPQLAARNFWVSIKHDELNDTIIYPGPFALFSATPIKKWRRAPLIGEHNEEIYTRELGLSGQELKTLKETGVI
jgi:crotonobetainyl-CoA:carnitine CoA-transferase CaiB-like acyl-CoA transferase